jgi:Tfp pilus assembly protein PilN
MEGDSTRFNRLVDQKIAIVDVLRSRPDDRRALLTGLYEHQSLRVRLNAALDTLAVAPLPARTVLERLRDWKFQPYAAEAWNILDSLDEGTFVPT